MADCGHQIKEGARFCTVCGRAVRQDRRTAPVAHEQPLVHGEARGSLPLEQADPRPYIVGPIPRRHLRWPWVLGLAVVLAAAGAGTAVLLLRSSHGTVAAGSNRPQGTTGPLKPASAAAQPAEPLTERQAAGGLANLLAQSVKDRAAVVAAVSDVSQCGPNLNQDVQTFESAATSRQRLLTQLTSLPGRGSLPGQVLQALTGAWQASAQADQDFAQWAQDEASGGCTQNDHSDSNYQAAVGPDDRATASKKRFASQWDPIAAQYGLPSYQWNRL